MVVLICEPQGLSDGVGLVEGVPREQKILKALLPGVIYHEYNITRGEIAVGTYPPLATGEVLICRPVLLRQPTNKDPRPTHKKQDYATEKPL